MDCQFNSARPRSLMSVTEMKTLETWVVKLYKFCIGVRILKFNFINLYYNIYNLCIYHVLKLIINVGKTTECSFRPGSLFIRSLQHSFSYLVYGMWSVERIGRLDTEGSTDYRKVLYCDRGKFARRHIFWSSWREKEWGPRSVDGAPYRKPNDHS